MVYEVPASKASIGQNRFEFKIGDDAFSIPKLKYLSVGLIEKLDESNPLPVQITAMASLAEGLAGPLRTLDSEQFADLVGAWAADSNVTLGESDAS